MKNKIFLFILLKQIGETIQIRSIINPCNTKGFHLCLKITEMTVPTHKLVGDTVTLVCKYE